MSDRTADSNSDEEDKFDGLYQMSFSNGKLNLLLGTQADKALDIDFERAMVMVSEKIREHADELWKSAMQTLAQRQAYDEAGLDWEDGDEY